MSNEDKFDWCEFYNFANRFSDSDNPAELRCGVSRFYYSAFCICREYVYNHLYLLDEKSKKDMTSGTAKVHRETINFFCNNKKIDQNVGKKIGRELYRIRKRRNKADYDSSNYNVKYDYAYVKARVNKIFENLKKL